MFNNAVRVVLIVCGTILVVIATFVIADYYGFVRWLQSWWNDLLCYFAATFTSDQFQELGPLVSAIVLTIAGLLLIRLGLSMQKK